VHITHNIQYAILCLMYSRLDYVSQTQIVSCLPICVRKQTGTDAIILHKLLKLTHYFLTRDSSLSKNQVVSNKQVKLW